MIRNYFGHMVFRLCLPNGDILSLAIDERGGIDALLRPVVGEEVNLSCSYAWTVTDLLDYLEETLR